MEPSHGHDNPLDLRSVSTWQQPDPVSSWPARQRVVTEVAKIICARSAGRLRVAVDGRSGSGKTTFGHELAAAVRTLGRPTLRASMDDFKFPRRHAQEHGYDRLTGPGYYRNAYDFASARNLLLTPAAPSGTGQVVLCAFDPLTGTQYTHVTVVAPATAILIVDTVFAFRREYDDLWEFRIWLDVLPSVAFARGVARDQETERYNDAVRVHRDQYGVAEDHNLTEVDPLIRADLVLENSDISKIAIVAR